MNVHDSFALVYHPNIGGCVQSICLLLFFAWGILVTSRNHLNYGE